MAREFATDAYHWGKPLSGLRVGLRAENPGSRDGIEVVGVARNDSTSVRYLGPEFNLYIKSDRGHFDSVGGPRSAEPIPLTPGEEIEFANWRLSPRTVTPGRYTCVLVYEPEHGSQLASGEIEVSVEGSHGMGPNITIE